MTQQLQSWEMFAVDPFLKENLHSKLVIYLLFWNEHNKELYSRRVHKYMSLSTWLCIFRQPCKAEDS